MHPPVGEELFPDSGFAVRVKERKNRSTLETAKYLQ
jgi:hypothetical protein